jgi:bifunctional non-homologous end joining protein LigD
LKSLPADQVILDGEIVALDETGRSSFQFKSSEGVPLAYYVFELLFLDSKDLRGQPLSAGRKLLAQLLKKPPENIRLSDELRGTKDELLRVGQQFGLEGLVAKPEHKIRTQTQVTNFKRLARVYRNLSATREPARPPQQGGRL